MLGISITQPYRQRSAGNLGYISLRYEIESSVNKMECADENNDRIVLKQTSENEIYADGSIQLAIELQPGMQICFNGTAVNISETGYFTDSFIKTIALPELIKGTNVLEISYPFGAKSMIEPCCLLGNFSVELAGSKAAITARKRKLEYGDITRQGFPFYTGNITYVSSFAIDEDGEWSLDMPHFAGALAEAVLDDRDAVDIAFAPYKESLGAAEEGGHEIAITLYNSRYNCFAPLHNSDRNYKWYGPDSFRTKGSQWTDEYLVKPAGILDIPRLRSKKPRPY